MNNQIVYTLLAVCVLSGLSWAESPVLEDESLIKCYKCYYDQKDGGPDKCPETGYDATNGTNERCPSGACVKQAQYLATGRKMERRCMMDDEVEDLRNFHGCKSEVKNFLNREVNVLTCVCHNDDCNAASLLTAAPVLVGLFTLLTLV